MKIVVDARFTRTDHHDGISRYGASLIAATAKIADVSMLISDRRQLALLPDVPYTLINSPLSPMELFVARKINPLGADVVVCPMQTMGTWGRDYRVVLTLHDLIYYRHPTPPRNLPSAVRLLWRAFHLAWWPQRVLLNRADAVVTVSETTRDLIARHRLTRRPVTVVPNAPDPVPDLPRAPRTRSLVYMGSFMPYKNVELPARAMTRLPGWELHLMSPVTAEQRTRLTELAGEGTLVFHDGASDEVYRDVLRGATALVSGSRDEGFGLPLVEAMTLGTPLVVSDIPVFREVGGAAGAYVDPETWAERSAAARIRAAGYDWDTSAKTLLALLVG